jgi:hypothetical protein
MEDNYMSYESIYESIMDKLENAMVKPTVAFDLTHCNKCKEYHIPDPTCEVEK